VCLQSILGPADRLLIGRIGNTTTIKQPNHDRNASTSRSGLAGSTAEDNKRNGMEEGVTMDSLGRDHQGRTTRLAEPLQAFRHFSFDSEVPPWSGARRFISFSIVCSTNSSTDA